MRIVIAAFLSFCIGSCTEQNHKRLEQDSSESNLGIDRSYDEIKDSIHNNRKKLSAKYPSLSALDRNESVNEIVNFWVNNVGNELYKKWENTPWDYNGTADKPNHGAIACGYFVTTILRDMDLKINRSKLAICPSSLMMKTLTLYQKIKNLSYLSFPGFNDALKQLGKGVYIIGLDFHTGFIVNDGKENWFIHSYFVNKKGVVKEPVLNSWALRSSKTKWLISLTNDKGFLNKWLRR